LFERRLLQSIQRWHDLPGNTLIKVHKNPLVTVIGALTLTAVSGLY